MSSFDQSVRRLGFCCKYLEPDQTLPRKVLVERQQPLNTRSTTMSWLRQRSRTEAEEKLFELSMHNIQSYGRLIEYVSTLPENLRMVRLGSDCLPGFTEPSNSYYYRDASVQRIFEREFARVGETARRNNVRISFHPGQFVVLSSDKQHVVENSIEELEYHATMARWMGYGREKFDMKINVHLSGARRAAGFLEVLPQLSPELRNCLTLENDEYQAGIDDLLPLAEHVGIVLDIHHHLIHDQEYIQPDDPRLNIIRDSWCGVRPVIHYSQPKEVYTQEMVQDRLPSWDEMISVAPRGKLRMHSDYYIHKPMNSWALTHWDWADIQLEAKAKNLAQQKLYEEMDE